MEELGLIDRLRYINTSRLPLIAYYLYGDPAYSTIYSIIGPYKKKPGVERIL